MYHSNFTAIILLSFVLAIGFLLVILSCALFNNWLPILVALTFVLAPLPNALASWCAGADDFSAEYSRSVCRRHPQIIQRLTTFVAAGLWILDISSQQQQSCQALHYR